MPTGPAEQLRHAREAQKLETSIKWLRSRKIKTDHIRALESGNYDSFSAPVYIRGFVRTYAKALKLDIAPADRGSRVRTGPDGKFREPPPLNNDRVARSTLSCFSFRS